MTNQMESAQPVSTPTTPTAGQGAGGGTATSPEQGFDVQKRIAELENQIRGLQKVGDKREAKFTERLAPLEDYARRAGIAIDPRIVRDMQVDEFLASGQAPRQDPTPYGNGVASTSPAPSETDYLAPIKAVGLDANDPEVLRLMMVHGKNPTEFQAQLVNLKVNRIKQPAASPAAAMPGNNPLPVPQGQEALRQEYTERLKTIRRGDADGLAKLKIEYRKRGLSIY